VQISKLKEKPQGTPAVDGFRRDNLHGCPMGKDKGKDKGKPCPYDSPLGGAIKTI
jgi:hypothetical protein